MGDGLLAGPEAAVRAVVAEPSALTPRPVASSVAELTAGATYCDAFHLVCRSRQR
jgi:hypothetical protein